MWLQLISPALLFVGPLLVWWLNVRQTRRGGRRAEEQKAYSDLLVASVGVTQRASTLLTAVKRRSGIREGILVTFGQRKPVDELELHDWIDSDSAPLMDAWSRTWVHGSPEGIAIANRLVDACFDVMGLLSLPTGSGPIADVRRFVSGVDVSGLASERTEKMRTVARARKDLADFMRAQTGQKPADLFSQGSSDEQVPIRRAP